MKYLILVLTILSTSAQAAQIKVQNADEWKVTHVAKNSPDAFLLGGAEFTLTAPLHKGGAVPTVLVFRTGSDATPNSILQWRELVKTFRADFRPEPGERILTRNGVKRYIAQMEQNGVKNATEKIFVMAMILNGELYVFSYQGYLPVFRSHYEDIFKLYRTISLSNE